VYQPVTEIALIEMPFSRGGVLSGTSSLATNLDFDLYGQFALLDRAAGTLQLYAHHGGIMPGRTQQVC
jgi:hypothetical protein